jgi:hypothetical protein
VVAGGDHLPVGVAVFSRPEDRGVLFRVDMLVDLRVDCGGFFCVGNARDEFVARLHEDGSGERVSDEQRNADDEWCGDTHGEQSFGRSLD